MATESFSFSNNFTHIIDGKKVGSQKTLPVINPSTGEVLANVPVATREQLDETVKAASRPFRLRGHAFRRAPSDCGASCGLYCTALRPIRQLLKKEAGKDTTSATFEVTISLGWLQGVAKQTLEDETQIDTDEKKAEVRYLPHGVCAGLIPWNFPLALVILKVAPALLTGNCLIIKPSPFAPLAAMKFIELAQKVVPPGVLSVLSGDDELGPWIVEHPDIPRISMTGSIAGGKAIMRNAATNLKDLTMELGGNDPAIVLDDVDPAKIAPLLFRVPMRTQNKAQYEIVKRFIDDCHKNGYKFALGGQVDTSSKGYFIPLTIIDNPPEDSKIVQEEQFGPIVPLLKWSDDDEVVKRANDTVYGLSASVWGHDLKRVESIANRLQAGSVWINEWAALTPDLPMSGIKQSGIGYENSKHGLFSWTKIQAITRNKAF
ncbi:NAD/NADP-dependent betaine aldehyde dehydrogenase [Grifola frondosa]|uniref:NAD/NADP-dependent betaine aldehyde dehydrogenase n=1 Tax=Grifola frondosa TaxID=5627 RepID=A0A1C7M5W6_GRIFR|nr:NAD/NADP-dependent betaine aldehyde dehydrogenase [Grifola frondosa]